MCRCSCWEGKGGEGRGRERECVGVSDGVKVSRSLMDVGKKGGGKRWHS